jgi:hypothetical protein
MRRSIEFMRNTSPQREAAPALPVRLLKSLERSKAQADAGETVPAGPIMDELRASITRMKAKRTAQGQT